MNTQKTNKTVSASDIARYFIWKANKDNKKITNKKLQKLLYYAQSWTLVFKKEPLFKDKIEAWVHGPAIKKVYDKYKRYGFNPITEEVTEKEIETIPFQDLLDEIWSIYGKYDANYLEELTHNEDPWKLAREGLDSDSNSSAEISIENMREYYSTLIKSK